MKEKLCMLARFRSFEDPGVAVLQRRYRLRDLRSKMQRDGDFPVEKLSRLQKEIVALQKRNYLARQILSRLEDIAFAFGPNVQERILLRHHLDRHGRSFACLYDRGRCADLGGCCRHSFGCCERLIDTYLRPKDNGGRVVANVVGHCTRECVCCIRFQGFYKHHEHNCIQRPSSCRVCRTTRILHHRPVMNPLCLNPRRHAREPCWTASLPPKKTQVSLISSCFWQ